MRSLDLKEGGPLRTDIRVFDWLRHRPSNRPGSIPQGLWRVAEGEV